MRRDSLNPFEYVAGASSVATYRAYTLSLRPSPAFSPSLSLLFIFLLQFVLLVVALEARSVVRLLAVCGFVFPIELQNCQLVKVEVACKTPLLSPLPLGASLLSCICLHAL